MSSLHTDNRGGGTLLHTLDIGRVAEVPVFPLLVSLVFLAAVWWTGSYFAVDSGMALFVIAASVIGAYMAMNIGANDVANNVAAAVGSRALPLTGAILMAVIFETAGALIAGGDVVSTISKGIIDPSHIADTMIFILVMGSALLAAALWLNLATWIGAPVSTTHSIVGGVVGAGVAAAGFGVVDWLVMSKIVSSWFISPVLGGVIAAGFLAVINATIFSRPDMLAASRRWVPILLGIMVAAFAMYLTMKGLKRIWKAEGWMVLTIGFVAFGLGVAFLRPIVARASMRIANQRKGVNSLFNIPLIFAAALLCFAHGANDVANAVGPLAAIVSVVNSGVIAEKVGIPFWIMAIGAAGIAIGLALFGAKLVKTVGRQLTTLDQTRAFCVSLSAAITVIAASALALPVSSTHIAIGAVFGVGFYREFLWNSQSKARETGLSSDGPDQDNGRAKGLLSPVPQPRVRPRKLVRRKQFLNIAAAWFVTVPSAAILAALVFFVARAFFAS